MCGLLVTQPPLLTGHGHTSPEVQDAQDIWTVSNHLVHLLHDNGTTGWYQSDKSQVQI